MLKVCFELEDTASESNEIFQTAIYDNALE